MENPKGYENEEVYMMDTDEKIVLEGASFALYKKAVIQPFKTPIWQLLFMNNCYEYLYHSP